MLTIAIGDSGDSGDPILKAGYIAPTRSGEFLICDATVRGFGIDYILELGGVSFHHSRKLLLGTSLDQIQPSLSE